MGTMPFQELISRPKFVKTIAQRYRRMSALFTLNTIGMTYAFIFLPEDGNTQYSQADLDNHANNCNPDHVQYYDSRDLDRPDDR